MILLETARLGVIGAVIGAAGVFFAVRFVDKMLYGVTSFNWLTLLGVGVTLAVVLLLASFSPARRATAVDPPAGNRFTLAPVLPESLRQMPCLSVARLALVLRA